MLSFILSRAIGIVAISKNILLTIRTNMFK